MGKAAPGVCQPRFLWGLITGCRVTAESGLAIRNANVGSSFSPLPSHLMSNPRAPPRPQCCLPPALQPLGEGSDPEGTSPGTIQHIFLLLLGSLSTRIPTQGPMSPVVWRWESSGVLCVGWRPPSSGVRGEFGASGEAGGALGMPPRCFMYQTVIRSKGQRGAKGY